MPELPITPANKRPSMLSVDSSEDFRPVRPQRDEADRDRGATGTVAPDPESGGPDQPRRLPCQVCGRSLVPLSDGTSRNHNWRHGSEDYCQGSRHRLERWPVGQQLRHHGGSVWEVIEDRGGRHGDYLVRCVVGQRSMWREEWVEAPGREMVTHGEYMHRDGWRPIA